MECCRRAIVIVSTKTNYLLAACNNIKHFAVGASYLQPPLKEIAAQVALTEMRIKAIANNYNAEGEDLLARRNESKKASSGLRCVWSKTVLFSHTTESERVNRPLCVSIGMLPPHSAKPCVHTREINEAPVTCGAAHFVLLIYLRRPQTNKWTGAPLSKVFQSSSPGQHGNRYCIDFYRSPARSLNRSLCVFPNRNVDVI